MVSQPLPAAPVTTETVAPLGSTPAAEVSNRSQVAPKPIDVEDVAIQQMQDDLGEL